MSSFHELKLGSRLVRSLADLGYAEPTAIQARSIPVLLAGRDLIGQSQTGSGKTAAFGLPILERIRLEERRIQALILCPTRELCAQVARELRRLGRLHPGLQILALSGGQPVFSQLDALRRGAHVAVGTPGRVLDHLGRGSLELGGVAVVVLDEADRMLDMGFSEDMERILGLAPPVRQTVLFSATYPDSIGEMSARYQREPVRVNVDGSASGVDGADARPSIRHEIVEVPPDANRAEFFERLLREMRPESAIVFCNLKATAIELARLLARAGVSAASLHGDLPQTDRDRVMAKFRNQSTRILVATDVAARGLDVAELGVVFNYDLPLQPEVYVHRVGRTGRAGRSGLAVALAAPRERARIAEIERNAGITFERKRVDAVPLLGDEGGAPEPASRVTFYISGGRKEKLRPGDILGALTGEAGGLDASEVGKIEIHDHFSYVAITREVAPLALRRLRDGRIKGRKFRVEQAR